MGDEDAAVLAAEVQQKERLTSVNVLGNKMGVASARALIRIMRGKSTLTTLCGFSGAETSLALRGRGLGPSCAVLIVNEITPSADTDTAILTDLSHPTDLLSSKLSSTRLSTQLPSAPLSVLDLANNNLTNYGDDMTGLRALTDAIKHHAALTALDLSGNWLCAQGAKHVAAALAVNGALTALNLSCNRLGQILKEGCVGNDEDHYQADTSGVSELADAIKENAVLTALDISNNILRAKGAKLAAEAMKENGALTSLNIAGNTLRAEGAKQFARALQENGALQHLDLSNNKLSGEFGNNMDGVIALSDAMKGTGALSGLTSLDLSSNRLQVEGARLIAEGLMTNGGLSRLDISSNAIPSQQQAELQLIADGTGLALAL
jgi:Ran GTPase-activating protein (RanGAP) involved in mRNA processing and transport